MSPYEQGRKGNAFRGGARRLPHRGNADMGQRGSGHLAVTGLANWATGMSHHKNQPAKQTTHRGVYVCQHLSITVGGKACSAMPRSEPSRGNPAARDRREACGNVGMMGAGLAPLHRIPSIGPRGGETHLAFVRPDASSCNNASLQQQWSSSLHSRSAIVNKSTHLN